MEDSNQNETSSTGLDEHIAGLLCYLGTFVTGLIFILLEKKSPFVKFHAMQSLVTFLSLWIVYLILDVIPLVGWFLRTLVSLFGLAIWIVLMIKAYQKELYKLPVASDIAETLMKKFDHSTNSQT